MASAESNASWKSGFDPRCPVINLCDADRGAIFYASAHTGIIYDVNSKSQQLLQGHCNPITCACSSADRRLIATSDRGADSRLFVWDSYSTQPVKTIATPHPHGVHAMDMSPDGKYLVTLSEPAPEGEAGGPQVIAVWDCSPAGSTDTPIFSRILTVDEDGEAELPAELTRFLNDGPPPIVFTLSVSAATVGGRFFEHSVAAAKLLGRRAVIIVGKNTQHRMPTLPDGIVAFEYVPFSKLFAHADVIVHAGGVGTTGLAMRSGRPMLVVPFGHDQPDNADRLTRLGVSRTIPPNSYTPARAAAELQCLFDTPTYFQRAAEVGEHVRHENGVRTACDEIDQLLWNAPRVGVN